VGRGKFGASLSLTTLYFVTLSLGLPWTPKRYLESLKRFRLPCVEPQTPSLLVALCARTGRLKQLAALLQYKVVPSESAIVAAGLLKGVDLARTRMKCGLEDSGADSGADSEADLVEQLALDSLWRQVSSPPLCSPEVGGL